MHLVYAEAGILDVIAVTLGGENGHFPKCSHKRSCLQKAGPGEQGADVKVPENARSRVGGALSQL